MGRLDPEKGVPTLLKAWLQMSHSHTLRIAGDGSYRPQLESFAKVYPNVEFMGWLPRHRVVEEMKNARFVVFPSEWYENNPLVIIEAFACGVPVIASDLGAMKELVEHGRTGFLFRAGDVNDLAKTMALAWDQPEYLGRLGDQARKEYEAKYTASANYQQLISIYQDVIAKHRSAEEPLPVEPPEVHVA